VVAATSQHLDALRETPQTPTQITQEENPPFSLPISRHHRNAERPMAAPVTVRIKQIAHSPPSQYRLFYNSYQNYNIGDNFNIYNIRDIVSIVKGIFSIIVIVANIWYAISKQDYCQLSLKRENEHERTYHSQRSQKNTGDHR
jgi:hypothetical protein